MSTIPSITLGYLTPMRQTEGLDRNAYWTTNVSWTVHSPGSTLAGLIEIPVLPENLWVILCAAAAACLRSEVRRYAREGRCILPPTLRRWS